uniref:serine/threonine-protein kinase Nek3-like n=1 Tax=Ciona intestinalis TaxID=7719 RepID=UPI0002B8E71E|nr:serine/threonine-protein kinase Nek3-like [Ciona intestinalis]|eukprot:XP_002121569.2 serine/threonine-protein kinase Nek3-like [Ciona intestinalis]
MSQKLVAIKKIEINEARRSRSRKAVVREADILRTLDNYHIVKCYEWFMDLKGHHMNMVLEYCNGGTLQDRILSAQQSKTMFESSTILTWTTQITSAVKYIHERRILHRDLKSENVFLVKNDDVVKLGDFGISKEIDHTLDKASTCVGTPCYLSPELCQDIPYSFKSDIWALGCLLFEMCALAPAFDAANLISLFYKIVNGKYADLPPNCSPELKALVGQILNKNPEDRPTAAQLLKLPILLQYADKIRTQTPEPSAEGNVNVKKVENHTELDFDMDDLDALLKASEESIQKSPSPEIVNTARSISVHATYTNDIDGENENDRPQTCPHSAVRRVEPNMTDTVATWSGYGDRGSRHASGHYHSLSSSSDDESDFNSNQFKRNRNIHHRSYSSDEFSSCSDDELNTSRKANDDEIPEMIEVCEDIETSLNSPKKVKESKPVGRNLPGSAWLQSKRAQVLRLKQEQEHHPVVISRVQRRPSDCSNHSNQDKRPTVKVTSRASPEMQVTKIRKQRLPGSSWLKRSSESSSDDVILGDPASKQEDGRTRRKKLPGSGWLLGKSKQEVIARSSGKKPNTQKNLVLESFSSNNESSSPDKNYSSDVEYPDDFEDYDDDFDPDDDDLDTTRTLTSRVSSLELVKQGCIDTVGADTYHQLSEMFSRGFSIGEVYDKYKHKVDFETLETCYLLLN